MESKSLKMEKKRIRTENWLEEDRLLLKELVRERVQAIENKNTDTNTNNKKKEAWSDLHHTFNALCNGAQRSVAQLKTQWSVRKIEAKKDKVLYRREAFKAGGGPRPKESDNQTTDDINVWLPSQFTTDSNQFDSDEISTTSSSTVTTQLDPLKKPEKTKRQQTNSTAETTGAAAKIEELESNCRLELHELQIENERKRARNLDLKYKLLMAKLNNEKSKSHHQ